MKILINSFFSFLRKKRLPSKTDISEIKNEELSFFKIVLFFSCILVISLFLSILMKISDKFSVEVPDYGGSLTFGTIGAPRFINPLLSTSETDELLTSLTYAGLVKETNEGILVPVLAESFTISPNAKEYEFILKDDLKFSDKNPLTESDVVFTFETKKSLVNLNNPNSTWSDISIKMTSTKTFIISTTGSADELRKKLSLGIVPKTLWEKIDLNSIQDSILNEKPIGAGPFIVKSISYENTVPKEILLKKNKNFVLSKPFLDKINVRIFANQLDLKKSLLAQSTSVTTMIPGTSVDENIEKIFTITPISTEKSISLLIKETKLSPPNAVAISHIKNLIDRNKIVDIIENGYGILSDSSLESTANEEEVMSQLVKLGYKRNEFGKLTKSGYEIVIPIVVRKDEQVFKIAEQLSQELLRFGISTELKVFDQGLFDDEIRKNPPDFILGANTDTPSNYKPIISLYTKTTPNISAENIHPSLPLVLRSRSEIFRDIEKWYTQTDKVWKWFN